MFPQKKDGTEKHEKYRFQDEENIMIFYFIFVFSLPICEIRQHETIF